MGNQLPVHYSAAEDLLYYFIPHPGLSDLPRSLKQAWRTTLHHPVGWLGDTSECPRWAHSVPAVSDSRVGGWPKMASLMCPTVLLAVVWGNSALQLAS